MFEAEAGEGVGVGGEEVEGVAEGGGGGVVAREEEEFDLVHEEGFHFGGEGVWFFVLVLGGGGDFVAGDGFAGEVGGESEVDDGFAAGDIGVVGGGAVDGEAGVEFRGEVVVHFAGVEPEDEGTEGVVAGEGEAFAPEGEPFHLTPQGGHHSVFCHLGVELLVTVKCKHCTACVLLEVLQNYPANDIHSQVIGQALHFEDFSACSTSLEDLAEHFRVVHHARHQGHQIASAKPRVEDTPPGLPLLAIHGDEVYTTRQRRQKIPYGGKFRQYMLLCDLGQGRWGRYNERWAHKWPCIYIVYGS